MERDSRCLLRSQAKPLLGGVRRSLGGRSTCRSPMTLPASIGPEWPDRFSTGKPIHNWMECRGYRRSQACAEDFARGGG